MRTYYSEKITNLGSNQVFVFGSNLLGYHGGGAAGYASFGEFETSNQYDNQYDYWKQPNGWKGKWNIKGIGEGLQEGTNGKSYALPTVKKAGDRKTISRKDITKNIQKMYAIAISNPRLEFLIAYSTTGKCLNGYEHSEMIEMFINAGPIPENIYFSKSYFDELNKLIKL